jgi:hypothetical protein
MAPDKIIVVPREKTTFSTFIRTNPVHVHEPLAQMVKRRPSRSTIKKPTIMNARPTDDGFLSFTSGPRPSRDPSIVRTIGYQKTVAQTLPRKIDGGLTAGRKPISCRAVFPGPSWPVSTGEHASTVLR